MWALWAILVSVVMCAVLSLIGCTIAGDISGKFLNGFTWCFVFFGGWSIPYAVFMFTFKEDDLDIAWKFSAGLYYGTLVLSAIFYKMFDLQDEVSIIIGFIVASLCCVIAWMSTKKKQG